MLPISKHLRTKYPLKFILPALLLACISPALLSSLRAEDPDTFEAQFEIDLCPEYRVAPVALDIFYQVGDDPAYLAADITSLEIDAENNTAQGRARFPRNLGKTPFHITAFCRNALAYGDPSNTVSVSNCDVLSQLDTDQDGLTNDLEDTDCDNTFSIGDASNVLSIDTDGDGIRDIFEFLGNTGINNAASSPRPRIYSSAPFDPDGDGSSNPVVWRGSIGYWYVRDFENEGDHLVFPFGAAGDLPFTYQDRNSKSDVGVIRNFNGTLYWFFRGDGINLLGTQINILPFGIEGDQVILGPWEVPGVTSPAIVRLINGSWVFIVLRPDATFRGQFWGVGQDIPKVDDYDGDGLFDFAVHRYPEKTTYVINSSDQSVSVIPFGSASADLSVVGDYSGDGKAEVTIWEPILGRFRSLLSDNGFDAQKALQNNPDYLFELDLGKIGRDVPLNWNMQNGRLLYTVVDHNNGIRRYHLDNNGSSPEVQVQWGLPSDHQG